MKLINVYKQYLNIFQKHNISDLSLKLLLCEFYNIDSLSSFVMSYDDDVRDLTDKEIKLINKVINGYPVQYALKKAYFYNMDFNVNKNVLIPRPETEELVENTIKYMQKVFSQNEALNYVDLGCGSGCILISIEKNCGYKFNNIIGLDISFKALLCTHSNIKKFSSAAKLKKMDMLKYLKQSKNKFNVITCNPPYISKINDVDDNVINYEPKVALFMNPSYYYYEKVLELLPEVVDEKFVVSFEIGYDLKEVLEGTLKKIHFKQEIGYGFIKDMYGNERMLIIYSK